LNAAKKRLHTTFAAWRSGGLAFRPPNQMLIIDSNADCDYVQLQLGCLAGADVQQYSVRPLALTSAAIMPSPYAI